MLKVCNAPIDEVIEKSMAGDEVYKLELLKRFYPLIVVSMNRYCKGSGMDSDDLVQEGNVMVLSCIDSFDNNVGVHFIGYIKARLKYLYMNIYRDYKAYDSLDVPIHSDADNSLNAVDMLVDEKEYIEDMVLEDLEYQELYDCIAKLSDRERQILVLFCIKGMDMHSIARTLGITFRTVANTKYKAMQKLKSMLVSSYK